jgi:hypothetical protein
MPSGEREATTMALAHDDDAFDEHRSAAQRAADYEASFAAKQRLLANPALMERLRTKLAALRARTPTS